MYKKGKRVIRRWRLDRFVDDEVKPKYRDALRADRKEKRMGFLS